MKSLLAAALLLACYVNVWAFEVDGLRSGMSADQANAVVHSKGLETWQAQAGVWAIGIRSQYRIDGSFSVCAATGLVAYSKNLDPDADYVSVVERGLSMWGQPAVSVRTSPWLGPGGGDVRSIEMTWHHDSTEIELSYGPEGRDGAGVLRYQRNLSIAYIDRSRVCHD